MDHRLNTFLSSVMKRNLLILSSIILTIGLFAMSATSTSAIETTDSSTSIEGETTVTSAEDSTTTTVVPTTTVNPVVTTAKPAVTTTTVRPVVKPPVKVWTAAEIRFFKIMYVNNITYIHGTPGPAMQAYRMVASLRGWTPQEIKSWEIAIANIMMGESGFCPNPLRGAIYKVKVGCILKKQGVYSDSGFGQLIGIHYRYTRPGTGWLCKQEGLCSKWAIIASPYNSMTALLALIERSGIHGWCYNSWARSYHRIACSNPGMDV